MHNNTSGPIKMSGKNAYSEEELKDLLKQSIDLASAIGGGRKDFSVSFHDLPSGGANSVTGGILRKFKYLRDTATRHNVSCKWGNNGEDCAKSVFPKLVKKE